MASLNNFNNAQVDSKDKEQETKICDSLPFEVRNPKPNKELLEALKESEEILSGKIDARKYDSVKELIDDLEKDV